MKFYCLPNEIKFHFEIDLIYHTQYHTLVKVFMLEFKYYTADNRFKFSGQGLYIDSAFFSFLTLRMIFNFFRTKLGV